MLKIVECRYKAKPCNGSKITSNEVRNLCSYIQQPSCFICLKAVQRCLLGRLCISFFLGLGDYLSSSDEVEKRQRPQHQRGSRTKSKGGVFFVCLFVFRMAVVRKNRLSPNFDIFMFGWICYAINLADLLMLFIVIISVRPASRRPSQASICSKNHIVASFLDAMNIMFSNFA